MPHYDVALWLTSRSSFPEHVQIVQADDWFDAIAAAMTQHEVQYAARVSVACVVAQYEGVDIERAAVRPVDDAFIGRYAHVRIGSSGIEGEPIHTHDADPQVNRSAQNTSVLAGLSEVIYE